VRAADPSVGNRYAAGKRPEKMKPDETILYNYATEMYRDKAIQTQPLRRP